MITVDFDIPIELLLEELYRSLRGIDGPAEEIIIPPIKSPV